MKKIILSIVLLISATSSYAHNEHQEWHSYRHDYYNQNHHERYYPNDQRYWDHQQRWYTQQPIYVAPPVVTCDPYYQNCYRYTPPAQIGINVPGFSIFFSN